MKLYVGESYVCTVEQIYTQRPVKTDSPTVTVSVLITLQTLHKLKC